MGKHFNEFELERYKEDVKWIEDMYADGHLSEAEKNTLIAEKKTLIRNEFGLDLPPGA